MTKTIRLPPHKTLKQYRHSRIIVSDEPFDGKQAIMVEVEVGADKFKKKRKIIGMFSSVQDRRTDSIYRNAAGYFKRVYGIYPDIIRPDFGNIKYLKWLNYRDRKTGKFIKYETVKTRRKHAR